MSRLDDRGIPALGAVFLGMFSVALWYGLSIGAAALDATLRHVVLAESMARLQNSLALSTCVQVLAMGSTLLIGLRWFEPDRTRSEALCLDPVPLRVVATCLVAGFALQFPLTELANALHHYVFGPESLEHQLAIERMLEAHTPLDGAVVVTCLAAIVPLTEELLFRGFFLFGLTRRYGPGIGLLGSSFLFGLAHVSPVPIVYATTAGLVLGAVAFRTGSVWAGVALHGAVNAVPVLLPQRLIRIPGFNVPTVDPVHLSPWLVWPPLAFGLGALAVMFHLTRGEADE